MVSDASLPGSTYVSNTVINGVLIERTLYIDSDFIEDCAKLWIDGDFTQLGIASYKDAFKLDDVDFLKDFPPVKKIHVNMNRKIRLLGLQGQANNLLKFFSNDGVNAITDFSAFYNLEAIGQRWLNKPIFPASMKSLKSMAWTKFKPATKNLTELPTAPNLERLSFVTSTIESLDGVEKYPGLNEFSLTSATQLNSVKRLTVLPRLEKISFDGCKKLNDLADVLPSLPVKEIQLINCSPLPSIGFVRNMPQLQVFVFVDVDVADGDMTPLLGHPGLHWAAFNRKKHFSHSDVQVLKSIEVKRAELKS